MPYASQINAFVYYIFPNFLNMFEKFMNMMKVAQFMFRKIISAHLDHVRKNSCSSRSYSGTNVPEYENLFKSFLNKNLVNIFSSGAICDSVLTL